jgi:hypothetical protein
LNLGTLAHAYEIHVKFQRYIEADTVICSLISATSRTYYRADADLESAILNRLTNFYELGRWSLLQYSRRKICGVEYYWYHCSIERSSLAHPCLFVTRCPALSSQFVVVVHLQALGTGSGSLKPAACSGYFHLKYSSRVNYT